MFVFKFYFFYNILIFINLEKFKEDGFFLKFLFVEIIIGFLEKEI